MNLTDEQRQSLYEDGYLHLPSIVPRDLVNDALRAINSSLGNEGIPPDQLTKFRAQSYCPEITGTPHITNLLNESPLWSVAELLIGEGKIKPVKGGQIALRFPTMDPPRDPGAHIDGMYTPTNGVEKGTIANFTALIGVFLSDVPSSYAGNFTVWPGSHRAYERYFQERGPESLLEGMPEVELNEPVQVTAKAGDAVLAHYQLGHGIAGNASPNIRYGIFFRLHHVDHDTVHWECMTDIWREWAGMQDLAGETARV